MELDDIEILVDRLDYQPRGVDPMALIGAGLSVLFLLLIVVTLPIIALAGGQDSHDSPFDQKPFEFVEARLLKFGKPKDENAMPNRVVPAMPTAPEEVLALDHNANKPDPPRKPKAKKKPQRGAVSDDKLREVFDRARAFAEIQDDYMPEGHPDGVPEGDVTDPAQASVGNTYAYRLKRIFNDRFIVPTLIPEAELKRLKAKVLLKFDIDMSIVSVRITKSSGNNLFDNAVTEAVERVRMEVKTLPVPPEVIAGQIFGSGLTFTFNGSDASSSE